jgi:hypothetical protein
MQKRRRHLENSKRLKMLQLEEFERQLRKTSNPKDIIWLIDRIEELEHELELRK